MSPVKLCLLSVPNSLFLPGSRNCCSQMNEVHRMLPSSVCCYESDLQNQVAIVTGFCMHEVGLLPHALCWYPVVLVGALGHFQKLWQPNHCQDHSHGLCSIIQRAIIFFSQESWHVLCSPF